jgi:hypothetical protein
MAEQHTQDRPRRGARGLFHSGLAVLVGIAFLSTTAILFFFDPSQHGFYPVCLLHATTGLQCPGCGSLRALHQLLHGNVVAAFKFNPLMVLAVPTAIIMALRLVVLKWRGQCARLEVPAVCVWGIVALLIIFTLVRNFFIGPRPVL